MISEFFLDVAVNFILWLAGLFGTWTPPAELQNAVDVVDNVMSGFHGVGVWVEWGVVAACMAAASLTWAIVFGMRVVMRLASHVPLVGGAG